MKRTLYSSALVLAVSLVGSSWATADPGVLLADFEGDDYGGWHAEGEAFGTGPAQGTLAGQMEVSGFLGRGLVNSYLGGDGTVGRLISPTFTISAPWLTFRVGGGYQPGRAEMRLVAEGEIVRRVTGPNARAGGSERLHPASWNVADLMGREARIEIVDDAVGGWGHINVDEIRLSARPLGMVARAVGVVFDRPYVAVRLPGGPSGHWPPSRASLWVDGREIHFQENAGEEAEWAVFDVRGHLGGRGEVHTLAPAARVATVITRERPREDANEVSEIYREAFRPQYHFTARENWLNDPNGLVYYDGEYHLFFQHNPFGAEWGNMTWGHAISDDLLHWRQMDHALHPDDLGTIFSGSAVIDHDDTAGFRQGAPHPPLVCIYTSAGQPFTQSIAYSTDRGRSLAKFAGNPVLGHIAADNRDPKVVWHEPTQRWVMALYLEGSSYALYASPNLKEWTHLQNLELPGTSECPDFFELPVDGDASDTRWVYWGANNRYMLGRFDGRAFTPDTGEMLRTDYGPNMYAAQTWSDIPAEDGRRIQIGWMNGGSYPGMPFNQQMSVPCELTLRSTPSGIRLFREPVREISTLVEQRIPLRRTPLHDGAGLALAEGELLDMDIRLHMGDASRVALVLRGLRVEYDATTGALSVPGASAPLSLERGDLRLRVLLDRTSVEVFAQNGLLSLSQCFLPAAEDRSVAALAEGGTATLVGGEVRRLRSVWD
ncbi:MAG: GH32 C-terminal domain-containing protein [Armatimonadota bacterium]